MMKSKVTSSDIYDINKKSGALILGKNRLDDYATKFLTKYCKQALVTPMPLPLEQIFQDMGLVIQEVSLSGDFDVFGCCLLLDGCVSVYDEEKRHYTPTEFKAGTILIDPRSEAVYGEGSKRNTLVHEALHWEKDKTFFEILKIKNKNASEKLYPILCRQSETFFTPPEGKNTKENEVKWLEWQAHRLAPRVLMPKTSFEKKAKELLENSEIVFCAALIKQLGGFFKVSLESVKYRLIEVGLKDTISEMPDYEDIYANIDTTTEYVKLTPIEALQFLDANRSLRNWVNERRYLFIDGYFVLDDTRYITKTEKGIHLTKSATSNLPKCAINIREFKQASLSHSREIVLYDSLQPFALYKAGSVDDRVLTFHPSYQAPQIRDPEKSYQAFSESIVAYDEDTEIELVKMIGDPTKSLCDCLWFLMEKQNWNYPDTFNSETGLHKNYHGKIKNAKYNNMTTNVLMAICVGLKLSLRITEKLFEKSPNKLDYYNDPDKTYVRIMETMPALSLDDFNGILQQLNIKELGSEIKE